MTRGRAFRREFQKLADAAVRDIDAIAQRPWVARGQAAAREECDARVAESRRVLDRLVYTIECRHGRTLADRARVIVDKLFDASIAKFHSQMAEVA